MDLRLALIELIRQHGIDPAGSRRLHALAGLEGPPRTLSRGLPAGVAGLAAALAGLGLVMWIAAQWDTLGRFGRFALLQGVVVAMCAGAAWRPRARAPLALVALLGIGALLAHFGQTYQTGADPWQLFALWAVLALPLALAARTDLLWAPWALVAMTAVSLWVQAHTGHRWRVEPHDLDVHLAGGLAAGAVVLALSGRVRRFTGAGTWSFRTAAALAMVLVTLTALGALFRPSFAAQYGVGLALLALAAAIAALPRTFDIFVLSAAALGLDTLLVAGTARLLIERRVADEMALLATVGLVAAVLLSVTVAAILKLSRAGRQA